ncbi:MAG: M48 family metalloprotease, partial [Zoogloeaceae bacterium]|nr:M48 family metalloprotease [Zoogloeaceae bacterium]
SDGGTLVGWAVGLTQMKFSRDQEARADDEALAALRAHYGHTNGADAFFNYIVETYPDMSQRPAFASTHPTPPSRLRNIRASFSPDAPELVPLSADIAQLRHCAE